MVKVLIPETRPQLQGSRLTAFELARDGIDCAIIPDTAVGYILASGRVDKVVVGADRITKDGLAVFNKIGTYQVAVLARTAPRPLPSGGPALDLRPAANPQRNHHSSERGFDEVVKIRGRRIAPRGVPVVNPAFDTTPPELVSGNSHGDGPRREACGEEHRPGRRRLRTSGMT